MPLPADPPSVDPHPDLRWKIADLVRQAMARCAPVLPDGEQRFRALMGRLAESSESTGAPLARLVEEVRGLAEEARFLVSVAASARLHPGRDLQTLLGAAWQQQADLRLREFVQYRRRERRKLEEALGRWSGSFEAEAVRMLRACARETAPERREEPADLAERLAGRLSEALRAHVARTLSDWWPRLQAFGEATCADLAPRFLHWIAGPYRLAGERAGVPVLSSIEEGCPCALASPSLAPGVGEAGPWAVQEADPGAVALLLPERWGSRWAMRTIAGRIPRWVREAGEQLRSTILKRFDDWMTTLENTLEQGCGERTRSLFGLLSDPARADTEALAPELDSLVEYLDRCSAALRRGDAWPAPPGPEPVPGPVEQGADLSPGGFPMAGVPSCIVCERSWQAVFRFLCRFQAPRAARPELCPAHAWLHERMASPRGLADLYPGLLEDWAAETMALEGKRGSEAGAFLERRIRGDVPCPACRVQADAEREAMELWPSFPEETRSRLCLRHLALALRTLDEASASALLRAFSLRLKATAEAMRGYALKFDARRLDLQTAEEANAHIEALVMLKSGRYVV